ncbi:hypothetical protein BKA56DRAFT_141747 [Ilyonectria sp. MPI-CAGE-AT-0026]|nr:hypothetical protein BKA56DRAFT_141747 [Ilyonectria sp. MPI-CAGE-AT-0026]
MTRPQQNKTISASFRNITPPRFDPISINNYYTHIHFHTVVGNKTYVYSSSYAGMTHASRFASSPSTAITQNQDTTTLSCQPASLFFFSMFPVHPYDHPCPVPSCPVLFYPVRP